MTNEHIDALTNARKRIVEWRRRVARDIAASEDQRHTDWALALTTYQQAVEAIDKAIEEEQKAHSPAAFGRDVSGYPPGRVLP